MPPGKSPWLRQEGETSREYDYFWHYCQIPPSERTAKGCAVVFKKSPKYIQAICCRNKWISRAAAYDDYMAEQERSGELKRRKKTISEFQKIGKALQNSVVNAIAKLNPERLTPYDIARLAELSFRFQLEELPEITSDKGGKGISALAEAINRLAEKGAESG